MVNPQEGVSLPTIVSKVRPEYPEWRGRSARRGRSCSAR